MSQSTPQPAKSMDEIVALCRRRGFIFQSSELYGGINGFWDYGPMGALLKKNLKDAWWHDMIACPPDGPDGRPLDIVPVEATIIMNPKVWEASGHVAGFNDPMQTCRHCKKLLRADHVDNMLYGDSGWTDSLINYLVSNGAIDDNAQVTVKSPVLIDWLRNKGAKIAPGLAAHRMKNEVAVRFEKVEGELIPLWQLYQMIASDDLNETASPCPHCGGSLTEPREFNLMFESHAGPIKDEDNKVYLRPETAQGIFTNFWNVVDSSRVKVPFGIAQVGKAFRNEVTPRNFTFRSREFEQMEIEFFIPDPAVVGDEAAQTRQWYEYWRDARYAWWQRIGLAGDNLTLREHDPDELAHYAKEGAGTSDVEYRFPFTAPGFGELEGVAHRTNYDLRQHAEHSGMGEKLRYFDQERNARYFPHVIEPSAGLDRGVLAVLCEAYTADPDRASKVYMKFHPRLAPLKAGVFPLVNKDGMPEKAEALHRRLRGRYQTAFDVKQSIGKRYARMDEAGTPYCFTVDGQTMADDTVTVRDRDTQAQDRVNIDQVERYLAERIG